MQTEQGILRAKFLAGMGKVAGTVNILTTDGPSGRGGTTATAMTSVSADSEFPTLLICLNEKASAAAQFLENGVFCVNVLSDDQVYAADIFASRYRDRFKDKFDFGEWKEGVNKVPRLIGALASFDCRVAKSMKVGTHNVLVGDVLDVNVSESGSSLVYADRAYRKTHPIK